ncbi:MAG TPA: WecB/TagA/CpsF family glycosyltransferase [Candidatus Woesebacteria bacterium]|jgi:N-acetylglucosaminyldiphosphoundecaprenol N-acetyl-beta-D-mannosaminyltransferase|nr:WecB/TagA/CpsF family glycosyltransferase [Candidatus Woesebacteria bacterium]
MTKKKTKKQVQRSKKVKKLVRSSDVYTLSYWKMFDIPLFGGDKCRVLKELESKLREGRRKYWVATVNPEFVMAAEKDRQFKRLLQTKTSLNVIDGIGLIWAHELKRRSQISDVRCQGKMRRLGWGFRTGVRVLKGEYKNKVASGADLVVDLAKMAKKYNKKMFLLGGWGDRAVRAAEVLRKKAGLKKTQIGACAGEPMMTNETVKKEINKFKPDILLVAYGMKRQEIWIGENLEEIEVGIVMGVGRSFDYYSGDLKRAPKVWRKIGLEWLYSLIKEPKRWKRQLVLPKFVGRVLKG